MRRRSFDCLGRVSFGPADLLFQHRIDGWGNGDSGCSLHAARFRILGREEIICIPRLRLCSAPNEEDAIAQKEDDGGDAKDDLPLATIVLQERGED